MKGLVSAAVLAAMVIGSDAPFPLPRARAQSWAQVPPPPPPPAPISAALPPPASQSVAQPVAEPPREAPAREHWFTRRDSRLLGGHRYIPPMLQRSAFVLTHFGVRQGVELFVVPDVALDFGKDDLRAAGITQTFGLDLKVLEFLGVYASGTGTVTSGIDSASAFEIGADVQGSFEAGAVLRLARLEPVGTQVSLRFGGGMMFETDYDLDQFVEAARQATGSQVANIRRSQALALLITPSRGATFAGALHVAQTLIQQVGLQMTVGVRSVQRTSEPFDLARGRRGEESIDELLVDASFALSFDAATLGVPLAIMPEYQILHDAVRSETDDGTKSELTYNSHYAGVGLYYSGRPNLVLGLGYRVALNLEQDRLQWNANDGTPRTSGTPSKQQAHFVIGYVW
ncbi:MAG: hypothetical protein ABW252_09100 [Polyangiales bacterium]